MAACIGDHEAHGEEENCCERCYGLIGILLFIGMVFAIVNGAI